MHSKTMFNNRGAPVNRFYKIVLIVIFIGGCTTTKEYKDYKPNTSFVNGKVCLDEAVFIKLITKSQNCLMNLREYQK